MIILLTISFSAKDPQFNFNVFPIILVYKKNYKKINDKNWYL